MNVRSLHIPLQPYGNKCGHKSNVFRGFVPPASHKPRPWLIRKMMTRLESCFKNPYRYLNRLQLLNLSYRKKRSERMEVVCAVAQVLAYYTDFETYICAIPKGEGTLNIDIKFIAKRAGKSLSRTKRAISDLIKAGYLYSTKKCVKYSDKVYRGLNSVKKLTPAFFEDLGITRKALIAMRKFKEKAREKINNTKFGFVFAEIAKIRSQNPRPNYAIKVDTERPPPKNILDIIAKKFNSK